MKRTVCILLTFLMLFSLAACGASDNGAVKAKDISEDALYGDWYDVDTFALLTLSKSGEASMESRSAQAPWSLKGGTIQCLLVSPDYPNVKSSNDGSLTVQRQDGVLRLTNDKYCFMRFSDLPMTELAFGETGSDEDVELTLEEVAFLRALPDALAGKVKGLGAKGNTALEEGQLYAAITYQLMNRSKSTITVGDYNRLLRLIIEYGDGYLFTSEDQDATYFTDGTNVAVHYDYASNNALELQPLQTKTITTYIRCPELVGMDEDAPLAIDFLTFGDDGARYYRYADVREHVSISYPVAAADVESVICAHTWTYYNPTAGTTGYMTFYPGGTGVTSVQDYDFDMTWTNDGALVTQKYSYSGTNFAATLELIYNNGAYELHNVEHPETIWSQVLD